MSTVQTEQVMVVPTELFHDLGHFQGFCTDTQRYLDILLDSSNTRYMPRPEMEQDPSFKQLIPYCIFEYDDNNEKQLFQYTRGSGSGESRLRSKRSIGIGGHISTLDSGDESPYLVGMQRELDEEIQIETEFEQSLVGLINDDTNDVGKVHLGIVHRFVVKSPEITNRESEISESGFEPVSVIKEDVAGFETWSQICLEHLYFQGEIRLGSVYQMRFRQELLAKAWGNCEMNHSLARHARNASEWIPQKLSRLSDSSGYRPGQSEKITQQPRLSPYGSNRIRT